MNAIFDEYTKFPPYVDSSMLETMKSCERSFLNRYCRNLSYSAESIHLVAGGAIAKAFEVTRKAYWEKGMQPDEALVDGVIALIDHFGTIDTSKVTKTPYAMVRALLSYFQEYGMATDSTKPLDLKKLPNVDLPEGSSPIEFNFRIPLPINNPDTGKPLILTGRLDLLADRNGSAYIVDEKTTGALSSTWATQWKMRGQFMCYAWACRHLNIQVSGAVVRGIGIYKTMIKHQEVIVATPRWKTDLWYHEFLHTLQNIVNAYKDKHFHYALSSACTQYSGCSFTNLCDSPNEQPRLGEYNRVVWHPEVGEQEILYKVTYDEIDSAMAAAFQLG